MNYVWGLSRSAASGVFLDFIQGSRRRTQDIYLPAGVEQLFSKKFFRQKGSFFASFHLHG